MKPLAIGTGAALLALFVTAAVARGDDGNKPANARTELRVSVRDAAKGLDFELYPDGHVELTIQETKDGKPESHTYKADSMGDFRKQYPEVAKKVQMERFVPRVEWRAIDPKTAEKAFEDWKRWFQEDWFWDREGALPWFRDWWGMKRSDDLDNWVEKQKKLFEQFRSLEPPRNPLENGAEAPTAGPMFGIRIDAVDEALASHTGLKEGEGALVRAVEPGSPAQSAGLVVNDIVLKIDGQPVTDRGAFRKEVKAKLATGFTLEVLRKGKHETLEIKALKQ